MGRVVAIGLATYALHLAWEMGQGYLFAPMERLPFWTATAWCARAAGWDVVISAAAYLTPAMDRRAGRDPRRRAMGAQAPVMPFLDTRLMKRYGLSMPATAFSPATDVHAKPASRESSRTDLAPRQEHLTNHWDDTRWNAPRESSVMRNSAHPKTKSIGDSR